jgi:putative ABC transport system substrate-binding protein
MRRRDFISGLGGAAAMSGVVYAQPSRMPVVGFLHTGWPEGAIEDVAAFRHGLARKDFIEGHNVKIDARWAEDHYERISPYAIEFVRKNVDVIFVLGGAAAAREVKTATTTIPIVFTNGSDAVATGLVKSLGRPEGNITGVTWFNHLLQAKRLQLLHELVPQARVIGTVTNPGGITADARLPDLENAAKSLGLQLIVATTSNEDDLDTAFDHFGKSRVDAVIYVTGPFFRAHRKRIISLCRRYALPAIYSDRDNIREGGLLGYGNSVSEACRQAGDYVGQILKGTKPSELPVLQSAKFELSINLKTAKALGIAVPPTLLARADEVIE